MFPVSHLKHTALVFLLAVCWYASAAAAPPHGNTRTRTHSADPSTTVDAQLKQALASAPKSTDFPDTDAACLLDLSTVEVASDGTVVETVRKAYKLFNQRGRSLAEVLLPYNSSHEKLSVVAARTIKANGSLVAVRREDIRELSPGDDLAMYNNSVTTGFSLPAIEDNCVIDYTYRKVITPTMSGQYASTWMFAGPYPVKLSRLIIDAPAGKTIRYKLYNDDICKPSITTTAGGKNKTYVFERRDLQAIVPEPLMPHPLEVAPHMEISTLSSWADVAKWYTGFQTTRPVETARITTAVKKLVEGKTGDDDKASAIYDWVVKNIRYVAVPMGVSGYMPHTADIVFGKRYGDSKDKTSLLIAMLAAAGIHADRALIHGGSPINPETRLPSPEAFNYAIAVAKVGGRDVWMDSAAPTCPYGDIPQADRGSYALVLAPAKYEFKQVPLYQAAENSIEDHETLDVHEDGSAGIVDRVVLRGSFAQAVRATMRAITPAQREQTAKQMIQMFSSGSILKDFKLPDGTERTDGAELDFSLTAPQYAQQAGDLLLVPFTAAVRPQNPFTQESRRYPLKEPSAIQVKAEVLVTIPKGYEFSRIPADVTLISPLNEQHLAFKKAADGRSVTVTAQTITKQGTAPAESFKQMQDYYKAIIKVSSEKIIVKKSGS